MNPVFELYVRRWNACWESAFQRGGELTQFAGSAVRPPGSQVASALSASAAGRLSIMFQQQLVPSGSRCLAIRRPLILTLVATPGRYRYHGDGRWLVRGVARWGQKGGEETDAPSVRDARRCWASSVQRQQLTSQVSGCVCVRVWAGLLLIPSSDAANKQRARSVRRSEWSMLGHFLRLFRRQLTSRAGLTGPPCAAPFRRLHLDQGRGLSIGSPLLLL